MSSFVHLHVHTHYSLLDGLGSPKHFVHAAAKQKSPALAITDHGGMYGAIEFYKEAKNVGVKPIIGCEFYLAKEKLTDKRINIDNVRYHLVLLAENNEGYENLLKLSTKSHLEGLYYKPRIDFEVLEKHNKGLIALSACLQGEIPKAILEGDEEKAASLIKKYQKIFGKENFFLEIQDHPNLAGQEEVNQSLIKLGKKLRAGIVITNDSHYVDKEDASAHDTLLCIQTNSLVTEKNRMCMLGTDFSLRPPEEIMQVFSYIPEAIENTLNIAKKCNVKFDFGQTLIPAFNVPNKKTEEEFLRELCYNGAIERYSLPTSKEELEKGKLDNLDEKGKSIVGRLNYELDMIHSMGFEGYFLIVWDFIRFAKENKITVGPGRGSAAGAIVSYCLKITELDPLKYNLIFERFLNPDRISMPDIDMDFADNRRDEVINYVVEKYGKDYVAQICTFGTMAARAAVKDVGRAMGVPFQEMNELAKLIPLRPGVKLAEALEEEQELNSAYSSSEIYKKVIDTALKMEGAVRHISVHACAVVISRDPLEKYTALQHPPKDDKAIITQYSAKPLESLGLLKMDFLGLKNLTIIQTTLDIIKRTRGISLNLEDITTDDQKTYELLSKGETTGVFQLESSGMKRYLKELKPTEFEDIIAMVSLYRPGPMDWIPDYIKGKHGRKKVTYLHDSLKDILEPTYGIAIYQEQILEIARIFAGFSLGEADILRRAIGKKISKELSSQREKFIKGAHQKGHRKELACKMFDKVIEPFANYGFNKSHGASYAMIAYHTAYLKAHFPTEFMAALMSADKNNTDRIIIEMDECDRMGIQVLPPDINESLTLFTVVGNKKIRFGLSAIKGLGMETVEAIRNARGKKDEVKFSSLEDFARRVPFKTLNKKVFESLSYCGAMDSLGERKMILKGIERIIDYAREIQASGAAGQTDIFGALEKNGEMPTQSLVLPKIEEASLSEKLKWEKAYLGLYVSSHPLAGLSKYLAKKAHPIEKITKKELRKTLTICGLIVHTRKFTTRRGDPMAVCDIEDMTGKIEITVFPSVYKKTPALFKEDEIITIKGRMEMRNGNFQIIVNEAQKINLEYMKEKARKEGFFDPNEKKKKTAPEAKKEEIHPQPKIFNIKIPKRTTSNKLKTLKKILEEYKGKDRIELIVGAKKILVPFGVKYNDELKEKVNKTLNLL